MGAGILPVALHNNQLYFLFGEEENERKWSDFGGSSNPDETVLQTALREGYEELNGYYGSMNEFKKMVKTNTLLRVKINNYTTIIVKVPYDENFPHYFNNNHKFINMHFPQLIDKNGFFEKRQIRWMTIEEIKGKRNQFRFHYKPIVDNVIHNEHFLLKKIE
jgi:8-oxo-dGTP pyrophosphatase MutT (NUDIX family)